MTTVLGASASLMIRVGALTLVALGILLLISAAAMADTIAVTPTGPAPVPDVPTITLLRDGAIMIVLVVLAGVVVWRASMLDLWMHSRLDLHGMAAALMEDEMQKRGLIVDRAAPAPAKAEPTLEPIEDPWAAEADKIAPPPPMPAPRRVQKSPKAMASDLSPFTARGRRAETKQ